jgi:hypothetical protein
MISIKDWKRYVDTGEVGIKILQDIAEVIKTRGTLDSKQLAIYISHSGMVETLLKLK